MGQKEIICNRTKRNHYQVEVSRARDRNADCCTARPGPGPPRTPKRLVTQLPAASGPDPRRMRARVRLKLHHDWKLTVQHGTVVGVTVRVHWHYCQAT